MQNISHNEAVENLKHRNKMLQDYETYQHAQLAKHEDYLSFPDWIKMTTAKKPECTKCNRVKKSLLRKGVRLKHANPEKG